MIDKSWTLFLDRDGVINERLPGSYVTHWEEFVLKEDFMEAMKLFRNLFGRIIIVTNQQGIGKGLMTEVDLLNVHQYFENVLAKEGITIEAIYYCPHLAEEYCHCRKPNIGLAEKAKQDFSDIDFEKSIMVGDSLSDILFGKRSGMTTVYIGNEPPHIELNSGMMPDYYYKNILDFAHSL